MDMKYYSENYQLSSKQQKRIDDIYYKERCKQLNESLYGATKPIKSKLIKPKPIIKQKPQVKSELPPITTKQGNKVYLTDEQKARIQGKMMKNYHTGEILVFNDSKAMYEPGPVSRRPLAVDQGAQYKKIKSDVKNLIQNEQINEQAQSYEINELENKLIYREYIQMKSAFEIIVTCGDYALNKHILRSFDKSFSKQDIIRIYEGLLELSKYYNCEQLIIDLNKLCQTLLLIRTNALKGTKISSESQERINEIFNNASNNQDSNHNYDLIDLAVDAIKLPFKLLFKLFDAIDDILGI